MNPNLDNTVEYIMSTGPYRTMHDANIPFSRPEFSSSKIITN